MLDRQHDVQGDVQSDSTLQQTRPIPRLLLIPFIPLLAALAMASPAGASVVQALDLAQLVQRADEIVVARAVSKQSSFDEFGRIVTDVELAVESASKGDCVAGDTIVVRHLGGIVGDLGMRVAGAPSFALDERAMVFARKGAADYLMPVAMSQGVLPVRSLEGFEWVLPHRGDQVTVRRDAAGTLQAVRAALTEKRRLSDVLREVRTLVHGAAK